MARRYDSIFEFEKNLNGEGLRIGIVMSRFNIDVCEGLLGACVETLLKQGVLPESMTLATVPGALEIPLALEKLAQSGRYDALVALGAVIRGETFHFEIVATESASGIGRVQTDTGVPVANAVLTTDTDEQALARMSEKGTDAALVAIEMANLVKAMGVR
ncbi:MAG: 6,7-dimethyl-8-ribityllumazine synthase [Pseudomonadota bacterium]